MTKVTIHRFPKCYLESWLGVVSLGREGREKECEIEKHSRRKGEQNGEGGSWRRSDVGGQG